MKRLTITRAILIATLVAPLAAYGTPPTTDRPTADHTHQPATDTATPSTAPTGELAEADLAALAHFHHVNAMEIDMGKMAQEKGTAKVKAYGKMLVRDHIKMDKDLVGFAKLRKLTIPEDQPKTDAERMEMKQAMDAMERLKTLEGAAFDADFSAMMVKDHQKELAKLDTAIANAGDAKLRMTLKKAQPVMKKHFAQAQKLAPEGADSATAKAAPQEPIKGTR
jgi:putative membrane protein